MAGKYPDNSRIVSAKMKADMYKMVGDLYEQEQETMLSFIENARRSLQETIDELHDEQLVLSSTSRKISENRVATARGKTASNQKPREGVISARVRLRTANRDAAKAEKSMLKANPTRCTTARLGTFEQRSAPPTNQLLSKSVSFIDLPENRKPEPSFEKPPPRPLEMEDFKEERDEIMNRMSNEESKMTHDKERQAALLQRKREQRANKMRREEEKANQLVREASMLEDLKLKDKERQEQILKEKLQERKNKKGTDDDVIIDVEK